MQNTLTDLTSNSSADLNLGVLGFGTHCQRGHLTKFRDQQVQLAVYDPSSEPLSNMSNHEHQNLIRFQSEEELLLSEVEAVLIMSPDEFHADALLRAVRAGKHVLVEKPLATTSAQFQKVEQALDIAEKSGLVVTSCHPRRFDPPYFWIKDNLPHLTSELGDLLHFEFDFSYHKPFKSWKDDRGLILDHANHEIDLVNWYLGHDSFRATRISNTSRRYQISGVRKDGVAFTFFGTRALENSVFRESVRLRFERGELTLEANSGLVRQICHEDDSVKNYRIKPINYEVRFQELNKNFIRAIKGEEENYLSMEDLYVNTALSVFLTEERTWEYQGASPFLINS